MKSCLLRAVQYTGLVITIMGCTEDVVESELDRPRVPLVLHQSSPDWSGDGRIVYRDNGIVCVEFDRASVDTSLQGIWILESATGVRRRVLETGDLPSWSPDNNSLALVIGNQIFRMMDDATDLEQLTSEGSNFHPDWSSDREWIVYDSTHMAKNILVWKMRSDGTGKTNLGVQGAGNWRMPAWCPGGSLIAHIREQSLFVMDAQGENPVELRASTSRTWTPTYSPDGTRIAFSSNLDLMVMNADGTEPRKISAFSGLQPAWSPDGSEIVYVRRDAQNVFRETGVLWIVNLETGKERQITFPWPERCAD